MSFLVLCCGSGQHRKVPSGSFSSRNLESSLELLQLLRRSGLEFIIRPSAGSETCLGGSHQIPECWDLWEHMVSTLCLQAGRSETGVRLWLLSPSAWVQIPLPFY